MTMLTRCPHCDTVFRVTPQQLQKQHGQVRCGRCMQVFDGFRMLSSESDRTVAEPVSERTEPAPAVAPKPVKPQAPAQEAAAATAAAAAPVAPPVAAAAPSQAEPRVAAFDEALLEEAPARPRHGIAWAAASALLALALAAQAAYVYRVELAAQYPALKPALLQACAALNCSVPLPQQPKLISIEASDLQVPDATRPGVIQLTATLRSHAQYDVAYPALDLVLTNAQEHTLARRIFSPREYLDKSRDPALGIPPNAEVTVRLDLDTGDLGASGFRIDLLAAPST